MIDEKFLRRMLIDFGKAYSAFEHDKMAQGMAQINDFQLYKRNADRENHLLDRIESIIKSVYVDDCVYEGELVPQQPMLEGQE